MSTTRITLIQDPKESVNKGYTYRVHNVLFWSPLQRSRDLSSQIFMRYTFQKTMQDL